MMLNMSNKFNNYQNITGTAAKTTASSSIIGNLNSSSNSVLSSLAAPNNFSHDSNSSVNSNSVGKAERESIHSGQFMVSTFEAEEAQDDLDDSEIKMLDPEDPSLSKPDEKNTCMEVQLYVPRKVTQQNRYGTHEAVGLITSHLEIETSLTKLFKCMNLAYSQKLTSPKWNHFKGVRLRWKDKIRLNNVIWRCWHMQFILKRRTPVCQFASPLDVDIHSNPQSVVLEGKYWKRQLAVIKAEYRKWRRNYKSKVTGCLLYDTRSEFDFLEWSPLNDKNLMLSDDWTSDTLFSAINGPFPFPDSREIARGAGIADFIQPSLGPLQPNLDDIDLTFVELLQNSRLPPVPEEGSDEIIKNVDYNFSSIMGHEQMDSTNMMEVATSNAVGTNDDTNMMELNTPLNTLQYSDIEQQFVQRANRGNQSNLHNLGGEDAIMGEAQNSSTMMIPSQIGRQQQMKNFGSSAAGAGVVMVDNNNSISVSGNGMIGRQSNSGNDFPVKKGRVAKSSQRPFRREPHNYDKAQPTLHQTSIYQQMLAEQQKVQQIQQLQQPSKSANNLQHQTSVYQMSNQQQQQQAITTPFSLSQQQQQYATTNLINTSTNFASSSENLAGGMVSNSMAITSSGGSGYVGLMNPTNNNHPNNTPLHNIKIEVPSTDVLSLFSLPQTSESFVSNNQYKPYPQAGNFKKSSSTGTYINVRGPSTNSNQMYISPQDQNPPNMHAQSLPLTLGLHLPGLANALQQTQNQMQLRPAQLSPPNLQQQQQLQEQQHQQQLQQQQSSSQSILPPAQLNLNQQQQQHHHTQTNLQTLLTSQQQPQLIQPMVPSPNPLPKEIYRSNSLPLNVSLQKLDPRLSQHDNFAVPKSHTSKLGKTRTRSNSIHQHMIQSTPAATSSVSADATYISANGLGMNTQLQTATSDPMLNSTLAQLLTTNSRMSSLGKQQSISSSAISALPNVSMDTLQVPPPMNVTNKIINRTASTSNMTYISSNIQPQPQQQQAQQSQQQQALSSPSSPSLTLQHTKQMGQTQQHFKHQPLHKSPKKSASLPTPVPSTMLSSPPASKMLSFPLTASNQSNLSLSPESFHDQDSPLSPTHSLRYPRENQRRAGHIHAEQKRRYNIKNGFDQLHDLIPQLQQNNAKLSKAAMLQKGAEHIKHLRCERNVLKERMETLRMERDALNNSLTHLHSILPANGAPVTRQGTEHVRQLYEQYVRNRTQDNWKFWILGLILEPLLTSYTSTVSSASLDELRRTAFLWVDQHCSLIDLRPAVSNKLKYLSMKTDILSDPPSMLKDEVAKALNNTSGQHPNLHGT